jgi:4-amino-4-deoxy-L-arabinose transferase-like glycosyltransferase
MLGQFLLFYDGQRRLGGALLVAAMLLGVLAWGRAQVTPRPAPDDTHQNEQVITPRELALRLSGITGAILLACGGMAAWLASPDEVFGLQGALWLASIFIFASSCARWRVAKAEEQEVEPPWSRAEAAAFAGLIGLSLLTYLTWLNEVPWRFHYDEAIAYMEAMRFYSGPQISVFTTTWYETSLPSLWFALSGALMHLVGTGLDGTRASVALVGALTVIPVYGLGRLLAGRVAALLAAFALATAPVAIHYSRVSIINSTTPFFWAVCFYFLLKGLRSARPSHFAWAGLAAGLSMYTYYGTRLLPYLLAFFAVYLAVFHSRLFRARLRQIALVPAGFLIGFGPLLAYFVRNPDMWAGRGLSRLNVPPIAPTSWDALAAYWNALAPLARLNFLSLSVIPSADHVYWGAFMLPAEAMLLLLGMGVLVWRWRRPDAFLILAWGASVLFVGGTLIDAPHIPAFAHWTPAFPFFFLTMALPPALWLKSLGGLGRRWLLAGGAVMAAGMLALALVNIYTYLVVYPTRVPPSFEAAQGRLLESLGPKDRVLFVGNSWQPFYKLIGEMMAPHIAAGDLLNPSRSLPLPDNTHDLTFVFHNDQEQYLSVVQSYYPDGQVGRIQSPGGPVGLTYKVTSAEVASRQGVLLSLTSLEGKEVWRGQVSRVGALPTNTQVSYPLSARWSGALFVSGIEPLRFMVDGVSNTQVWVQGERAELDTPIALDAGWVPFTLHVRLERPTAVRLLMQQGDTAPAEVDTDHLWPQMPGSGLALTLNGDRIVHRIDPFIGSSIMGVDTATGKIIEDQLLYERDPSFLPLAPRTGGGNLMRWEGEVYAPGGRYTVELRTDARARLSIDGNTVLDLCDNAPVTGSIYSPGGYVFVQGGYPGVRAAITLPQGWHKVRMDLHATGKSNGLEWTWTRPDGVREIVPPARLRYGVDISVNWPAIPEPIACP